VTPSISMLSLYDATNEHTVHGKVVRVGTRPPLPGMASGIELQVQTDEPTTVQVHVGPEWYLERQAIELREDEAVQVTGARAEVDGQPVLLARTITVDGLTLMVRDIRGSRCGAPSAAGAGPSRAGRMLRPWDNAGQASAAPLH